MSRQQPPFEGNIALIGFMGTGKSTVSTQLMKMYELEEADVDAMIVEREGMAIKDIFAQYGEDHFRECETEVILELQERTGTVICCGGGAVVRKINVDNLKKGSKIVLLTATPATVLERCKGSDERPILNGNMNVDFIAELMEKRRALYEDAADVIIATDGKTAEQICEEMVQKLSVLCHS